MSAREWKPGDVAIIRWSHEEASGEHLAFKRRDSWITCDEGVGHVMHGDVSDARPLLVLDPEDHEQVARLADAFCYARWSHVEGSSECDPLTQHSMEQALNSLLTPPKPEEPKGLGAVVEDAKGERWVRVGLTIGDLHWRAADPRNDNCYKWVAIAAVRVLSEGVTDDPA